MMPPPHRPAAATALPPLPDLHLRAELLGDGWHDRAIARQLRSGAWVRIRAGAYCDEPAWRDLDEAGRHRMRVEAVRRHAGTEVVVSHVSALVLHGAPTWGLDLSLVHVTRTDSKAGRREAGVYQHAGRLVDGDVVEIDGVQVTSPTRAALESTTLCSLEAGLVFFDDLLRRSLTDAEALEARYRLESASIECWPRTLSTEVLLRLADGRRESVGESRTFHLVRRAGLPAPTPQFEVHDELGRLLGRVDFAWPELKVFVEFDGKSKYEKHLKPGESVTDVVLREKNRESAICRATGWRCVRLTWADLENPTRTIALLRTLLLAASAA